MVVVDEEEEEGEEEEKEEEEEEGEEEEKEEEEEGVVWDSVFIRIVGETSTVSILMMLALYRCFWHDL